MTRAKELLDAATPLPWAFDGNRLHPADSEYPVIAGPLGMEAAKTHPDDAALIVYAVNRLPNYEAAVEALKSIASSPDGDPALNAAVARKALARFDEKVTA